MVYCNMSCNRNAVNVGRYLALLGSPPLPIRTNKSMMFHAVDEMNEKVDGNMLRDWKKAMKAMWKDCTKVTSPVLTQHLKLVKSLMHSLFTSTCHHRVGWSTLRVRCGMANTMIMEVDDFGEGEGEEGGGGGGTRRGGRERGIRRGGGRVLTTKKR